MRYLPLSRLAACVLSLLFFAATACEKPAGDAAPAPVPTPPPGTALKTYLALGDSYTIGQGVAPEERFPYLAVAALQAQGVALGMPQYIATTGWTSANLQSAIGAQPPQGTFDVVSLLIGVNDQYQGVDTGFYRTRFTQLLAKAVELAAGRPSHVFVLSIPDYSATPFVSASQKPRVSREIGWFNAINKEVTLQQGIPYIDITPLTREAATDPTLLAPDGLHYSGKEHQKWASLLAPAVKAVL
ncbi:MAG: lysophospholipase and related esterase [Flaviaesturariibacter sp.]|nr:lysophospholipase and related esterase [Flaviaesturariibacter sp.]